jgi:CheY-like chemotaxis protein
VLVVDDDDGIRDFVTLVLSDEGYDVVGASNGAAALDALNGPGPDVILLDTRMPVMDGVAFAQAYRELPSPHAPIIVLTAASDPENIARELAADAVLQKPFDLDDLLDLVGRFSAGRDGGRD